MAKKQHSVEQHSVEDSSDKDAPPVIPEGYKRISSNESKLWYRPKKGDILTGDLLGRFKRRKPQQGESSPFYYQVRVAYQDGCEPIDVHRVGGETDEDETCEDGAIINVQEWAGVTELSALCDDKENDHSVYIICVDQIKLEGNRKFWKFEVYDKATPKNQA